MMKVLTACLLLVLAVGAAYGLKCYECDGSSSFLEKGDCGDTYEPDSAHVRMCNATAGEIYCEKVKYGVKDVITSVTRRCSADCDDHNIVYAHRELCCQTDLCNASPAPVAACFTLISVAALLARLW